MPVRASSESPIVNVHIEKAAGRSLRGALIGAFGPDKVLVYNPRSGKLIRASNRVVRSEKKGADRVEALIYKNTPKLVAGAGLRAITQMIEERRAYTPDNLPGDFDAITGHFYGDTFEEFLPPAQSRYVSVVRDPLKRMQSHYEHWRRTRGQVRFRVNPPYDKHLNFEQFAFSPELQNFQANALAIDPSRYFLLGVVEHLAEFLEELGISRPDGTTPENGLSKLTTRELGAGFRERFELFHSKDYELYESLKETWKQ